MFNNYETRGYSGFSPGQGRGNGSAVNPSGGSQGGYSGFAQGSNFSQGSGFSQNSSLSQGSGSNNGSPSFPSGMPQATAHASSYDSNGTYVPTYSPSPFGEQSHQSNPVVQAAYVRASHDALASRNAQRQSETNEQYAQRQSGMNGQYANRGAAPPARPVVPPAHSHAPGPVLRPPAPFTDYGPGPFVVNIEQATLDNDYYRQTLWTGPHMQSTLMTIPAGGDIGLEVHPDNDQFLRLEEGQGLVQMGDSEQHLPFRQTVFANSAVFVPAGTWHNITNIGNGPMKLYVIYSPKHHPPGTVHATKAIADAEED